MRPSFAARFLFASMICVAATLACSKTSNPPLQTGADACATVDVAPADNASAPDTNADTNSDADPLSGLPSVLTLTTLYKSPLVIEGLTADGAGNLYVAGRGGNPCAVWRVASAGGTAPSTPPATCSSATPTGS